MSAAVLGPAPVRFAPFGKRLLCHRPNMVLKNKLRMSVTLKTCIQIDKIGKWFFVPLFAGKWWYKKNCYFLKINTILSITYVNV
jgi:hypothetical protein